MKILGIILLSILPGFVLTTRGNYNRKIRYTPVCPPQCVCSYGAVKCSSKNLTEIPTLLPRNTEIFLLENNNIQNIRPGILHGLRHLVALQLNNNQIRHLPSNVFVALSKLKKIRLDSNQLTELKTGTFSDLPSLLSLFLQDNRLRHIPFAAFHNLPNLRELHLQENVIASIDSGAFANMPHLELLRLNDNQLPDIKEGIFDDLPSLQRLLLYNNRLMHISADTFRNIPNLSVLLLQKNYIARIDNGSFGNMPKLDTLRLDYNQITDIEKDTFSDLPSLKNLLLQKNRLRHISADAFRNIGQTTSVLLDSVVCDCEFLSLIKRMRQNSPKVEMIAICQYPNELRGRNVSTISVDDFHCSQPRIAEGPSDIEVDIGGTAIFVCKVTGDPPPKIKWMRDSNELNADDLRYKVREDGCLVISDVTENDVGEYECIAQSNMGSTHSRKARALVNSSPTPRFLETPRSRSAQSGDDVTFVCRVEGRSAIVEWWRNGVRITSNGRFILDDQGSILKILAVKESDTARYVCQARNTNGFAETSVDLTVHDGNYKPPKLTYEPQDMEVEPGATVEMPCRAEGHPDPRMHWKKDGSALEGNRTRMSRHGSLYLYNIIPQDSGRYECSAVNEYGRATAQALLRVRQSATDGLVLRAFTEATRDIDRAINNTLQELFNPDGSSRSTNPFRLSRFPDVVARQAARPAEVFERTLQHIRRMVNAGASANVTDEFHYNEILSPEQVTEIEKLSGCTPHRRSDDCANMCFHIKYRSIDGKCNNLAHPTWGSSYTGFRRVLQPIYENGFSQPVGWDKTKRYHGYPKPAARLISTTLISTSDITSDDKITHMVMQWGQFLDHDLDHALPAVSSESWDGIDCKKSCDNAAPCFPMEVPPGDPRIRNRRCIDFFRTSAVCGSGMTSILWGKLTPREQLNQLTSYLDASQVYGYEDEVAKGLRDLTTERGLLREGPVLPGHKPLLPYANGEFVDCRRNPQESSVNCFVTGDFRANEQVGLLAMHTIWLREHNRLARRFYEINPHWSGEKIYQEARKIVGAEMQHITYQHWIPRVLGGSVDELLGPYQGYNAKMEASISNVFATAALRFGHSLIQPKLERLDENFQSIPRGALHLRDAFFSPWRLVDEGGTDPLMRGMFATAAKLKMPEQNLNVELTEQLFRTAHAVALDLAAMNIQRGRDHALPSYTEWRKFCKMSRVESFDDLAKEISSATVRQKLRELYGHPGNIDVWVGGILEDQLPGAKVGPLFRCLLIEQFQRMRNADRFWYENPTAFKSDQLNQVKRTSLARILCDNGDNITRVQRDVFLLPEAGNDFVSCDEIPSFDLRLWSDCCEDCDEQTNTVSRFRRNAEKYFDPSKLNSSSKQNKRTVEDLEESVSELKEQFHQLMSTIGKLSTRVEEINNLLKKKEQTKTIS